MLIDRLPPIEAESPAGLSRRGFIRVSLAAGGGLLLGVALPLRHAEAAAEVFAPNAFVRIDRGGRVTLILPQVEMGQGIYTAQAMLIAEELEVDLATVQLEAAPPDDKLYANPLVGFQATGGSTSVRGFWEPLRRAGATARVMLVAAAAESWGVEAGACRAGKGVVTHPGTGRKLGYGELAEKAANQPVPENVALKDPKDFTLIGTPAKRLDTPDKVNGKAMFGIDTRLPGMKFATLAICPVFGGKLKQVDDGKARMVKGMLQVVQIDDAVAVVAEHMGAAKKGLEALDITWDDGPNAKLASADIVAAMDAASRKAGVVGSQEGDAEKALAGAAKKVEAVYQMPFLAHAAMEPMNCTVHVQKDRCEIWVGTQVASRAQATAAEVTGLPLEKVQVHNQLLGGGFGRRLDVDGVTLAVRLARHVEGPVKIVWTREQDIQHDVYRPYYYDRFAAGLDAGGMPVAFHHRVTGSSILARWAPPYFKNGLDFDAIDGAAGPYGFPSHLVDYVRQEPPAGIVTGWWRGVGVTHNAFMVEGFMDELAQAAGKDPVDYRRALLAKAPRALGVLNLAAAKADWGRKLPPGRGMGVSLLFGFASYIAEVAEVSVDKDGRVKAHRIVCAVDCGHTVNPDTIKAQIEGGVIFGLTAALYGDITIKDGRVEQGNFDSYQALRIDEAPEVEVHIVESTEAPGGIGEPGTAAIAPAIVNAIFAATGKRLRKLPIDPAELKSSS
jgi:isoquinoline 1-oxidoreductase subunit beta